MKRKAKERYKNIPQARKDFIHKRNYQSERKRFSKMTNQAKEDYLKRKLDVVKKSQEKKSE